MATASYIPHLDDLMTDEAMTIWERVGQFWDFSVMWAVRAECGSTTVGTAGVAEEGDNDESSMVDSVPVHTEDV